MGKRKSAGKPVVHAEPRERGLREVDLDGKAPGRLFIRHMPGKDEDLASCWKEMQGMGISRVVSLAGEEEIAQKAPAYHEAIRRGDLPYKLTIFEVEDYGVPPTARLEAYAGVICGVVRHLRAGGNAMIHCSEGVGRSGLAASCVLMALGMDLAAASMQVAAAGAYPPIMTYGNQRVAEWFGEWVEKMRDM